MGSESRSSTGVRVPRVRANRSFAISMALMCSEKPFDAPSNSSASRSMLSFTDVRDPSIPRLTREEASVRLCSPRRTV